MRCYSYTVRHGICCTYGVGFDSLYGTNGTEYGFLVIVSPYVRSRQPHLPATRAKCMSKHDPSLLLTVMHFTRRCSILKSPLQIDALALGHPCTVPLVQPVDAKGTYALGVERLNKFKHFDYTQHQEMLHYRCFSDGASSPLKAVRFVSHDILPATNRCATSTRGHVSPSTPM